MIVIKLHHTLSLAWKLKTKSFAVNCLIKEIFSFSVVRMPYKCSNMPYKMFYATISAEVLRICRATSDYRFFLESVTKLITRMQKQGAKTLEIKKIMIKMMSRHWENFVKFRLTAETSPKTYSCGFLYTCFIPCHAPLRLFNFLRLFVIFCLKDNTDLRIPYLGQSNHYLMRY